MPDDTPQLPAPPRINWEKVDDAINEIFEVLCNRGFTLLEQDTIVTAVWTKITTEKLIQIAQTEMSLRMAHTHEEHKPTEQRPPYYG